MTVLEIIKNNDFDEVFYEGDRNSVYCKKHKALATPIEVRNWNIFCIKQALQSLISREEELIAMLLQIDNRDINSELFGKQETVQYLKLQLKELE